MSWRIIDANCGVGPWATRERILPALAPEILAVLDQCGIERALVYGNLVHKSADARDVNEYAASAAAASGGRFMPAFVLAPNPHRERHGIDEQADAMRRAGAKAAWLWPQPGKQSHYSWPWLLGDIYAFCSDGRIPLMLQADGTTPDLTHDICTKFPHLRLVLAGLDYSCDKWLLPLLTLHPNLHACCGPTYVPPLGAERFVKRFGSQRLIFGSGLPFYSPGGLITYFAYADIPDSDKAAIFAGNIERLMAEVKL